MSRIIFCVATLAFAVASPAAAGVKTKAAKEAAEYVTRKFGKEAADQSVGTLTRKIEVLAVKNGDEAIIAVKRVGPRTFQIVEDAGENAGQAIKLMARKGDDALWVVAKKNRLATFAKYGDDAAEAMIKHGEVAEPLIDALGKPAAGALNAVSKQSARRMAMLADDGALAQIGRTDELLTVVSKYGDRAMDFIWRNKGSLAIGSALTAFLLNPQPFLDGTADITRTVAENVAKPITAVSGAVATHAVKNTNWTLLFTVIALCVGTMVGFKAWLRHRATSITARGS